MRDSALKLALLIGIVLMTISAASSCGAPLPESKGLLPLDSSPEPLRNRSLEAFLLPNVDRSRIASLAARIAAHAGVQAWAYDEAATPSRLSRLLTGLGKPDLFRFSATVGARPASFIIVAQDGMAQDELVRWLAGSKAVRLVVFWFRGQAQLALGT